MDSRRDKGKRRRKPRPDLNKIRLITFTDDHDDSYSFYHFILFLYILAILLLYTTYGCLEAFPYGHIFVACSIAFTTLPVLLAFIKASTSQRDTCMKFSVACLFFLLSTGGAYAIYIYSDNCAAELIRYNTTVSDFTNPQAKTSHYNLFTLTDGEVVVSHVFYGQVVVKGLEVDCAVAPLASSVATFNPSLPIDIWVADFVPRLVLANWSMPLHQIIRADDNLQRAAQHVIATGAANYSLQAAQKPQVFRWQSFDTTPKFDRKSFIIAAAVVYGLLAINTLIPPIYFYFQHTRTATLEITEETYLLAHHT